MITTAITPKGTSTIKTPFFTPTVAIQEPTWPKEYNLISTPITYDAFVGNKVYIIVDSNMQPTESKLRNEIVCTILSHGGMVQVVKKHEALVQLKDVINNPDEPSYLLFLLQHIPTGFTDLFVDYVPKYITPGDLFWKIEAASTQATELRQVICPRPLTPLPLPKELFDSFYYANRIPKVYRGALRLEMDLEALWV